MPFNRTHPNGEPVIDRTQTGPPAPSPQTGTVRAEDGSIVADSSTIEIPRATPVNIDQPSPFEPVIDAEGRITPRWWRFLDQLYRRTGGVVDNINRVPTTLLGADASSTVAVTIAGIAPSAEITHIRAVGTASMSIAGNLATHYQDPTTGSMTVAGAAPTVSILISVPVGSMALTGELPIRVP